jgi:hypothetical protein
MSPDGDIRICKLWEPQSNSGLKKFFLIVAPPGVQKADEKISMAPLTIMVKGKQEKLV